MSQNWGRPASRQSLAQGFPGLIPGLLLAHWWVALDLRVFGSWALLFLGLIHQWVGPGPECSGC